jgi:hypothetical protein
MFSPSAYTEAFDREQGFTPAEWLYGLRGAVGAHALTLGPAEGGASVQIDAGRLQLRWTVLPPRVIALMRMPRLAVQFRFCGLSADERAAFMRYFDLVMQKGGG